MFVTVINRIKHPMYYPKPMWCTEVNAQQGTMERSERECCGLTLVIADTVKRVHYSWLIKSRVTHLNVGKPQSVLLALKMLYQI